MRYATSAAFRTALERRLLTTSQQAQVPVVRLRKLVVFDRLLARLLVVAPERWLLKGALALDLRLGTKSRTTKDLDLVQQDNVAAATDDLLAAQAVDLGDFFAFVIEKRSRPEMVVEGVAVRYHVAAELAGRPFEDAIVDIGFGDPITTDPEILTGPNLLSFADIERIAVPALLLAQHIAEKVHAYTRTYTGHRPSSRVKDLVDLVLIRSFTTYKADRLYQALRITFERRGTHALPATLPKPPSTWRPAYRKLALEVGLDPDIRIGHQLVAAFLDPILLGTAPAESWWDPRRACW